MCQFFSLISDGDGKVQFFKPEDVISIMVSGNKDGLDFNSHTSLMSWLKIKGTKEDNFNKWEYNPETKELKQDELQTDDDSKVVKFEMDEFFKGKDVAYMRNLYGRNAGSRNAGSYNAGSSNAGSDNAGSFCTKSDLRLFDKPCTFDEHEEVKKLDWSWFSVVEWVPFKDMTKVEKETFPSIDENVCGGYFKPKSYKEAWEKCPKSFLKDVKKLKNYDAKVFKEITGLDN